MTLYTRLQEILDEWPVDTPDQIIRAFKQHGWTEPVNKGEKMLTLEKLKAMEPHTVFATGETTDDSNGANMTGSGQALRWVAVRGGIHDWAIYIHKADWTEQAIKDMGDKVHNRETVKKLVPCDEQAMGMYRD